MQRSHPVAPARYAALLGFALLVGYAPHATAPAATAFAPTISSIPGPSDGVVCALLTGTSAQLAMPTASYGRIGRVRRQDGVNSCGAETDHRQSFASSALASR